MLYTELTQKAMQICYKAHEGQFDKGGVPYVFHPIHVAEQMDTEEEICVALLHDILEDTNYSVDDLVSEGFSKSMIDAIECITRPKGMDYLEYIDIVKTNKLAVKVKLADLEHNNDEKRMALCKCDVSKLKNRYEKAKIELLKTL